MTRPNKVATGLALGGGAVLGAAHIGVLQALSEFNFSVEFIAGTSIGSFVASLYAFGKTPREIQKIALDLKWPDVSGLSLSRYGLLSLDKLGTLVEESIGDVDIQQAKIPLALVTTDITSAEKIVLREGPVASGVMASSCIPGIFKPVTIGDRMLVDGGIVENVPVSPLKKMGAERIFAVDLNACNTYEKPDNIVDVLLNSFDMVIRNATRFQTREADILITPDLSGFSRFDTSRIEKLVEEGYRAATEKLRDGT